MHTIEHRKRRYVPMPEVKHTQEPFTRVAPIVKAALLLGAGGGFVLATVLTLSRIFSVPLGTWWQAVAQAHGHLQLYGWVGLFVLGIALHFLPRLRGTPLVGASFTIWLLLLAIISLILRAVCQPLLAINPANVWRLGLVSSGILEVLAFAGILSLMIMTALRGPRPMTRPAYWSVLPFLAGAFCSLGIASIINMVNVVQAASGVGLALYVGDTLNVTLGLFGFLVPMALAMSARSLPMYAGLDGFPHRVLWPLGGVYFVGLVLLCVDVANNLFPQWWTNTFTGLGMVLLGGVVFAFISIFLRLMYRRGRLPQRVAQLAPEPAALAQTYKHHVKREQTNYGPFVGLVASAYLWAMFGALLLLIDGGSLLTTGTLPFAVDAVRHSFAIGFLALLICGIAPRMLPSFSGGRIVSPKLVSATLWLGNTAAVLRVGSILFAPFLPGTQGYAFDAFLFSLSGPFGLALAICLAINLWPMLRSSPRNAE